MYPKLSKEVFFLTGKSKQRRKIPIRPIYEKIGPKQAAALLGFHSFTESDVCGRFAVRTKDWCLKVFLACDDIILDALASLGRDEMRPSLETMAHLERFVCLLYRSKVHTQADDFRWFLYSACGAEGESLPRTRGSLIPHILRAHYIAMVWMKSVESHPGLPPPSEYGCTKDEGHFVPIRCMNSPAPEAPINLVKCGCKKGCVKKCSCRNNNIPCTEMCGCIEHSCSNNVNEHEESVVNDIEDEDGTL